MENPMQKMFSGKNFSESMEKERIGLKELEHFYKKVREVQLNEIRELIIKLNNENKRNLDLINVRLNEIIHRDVIERVALSLKNSKDDMQTAIDKGSYYVNKRIAQLEKYVTIVFLIILFLLIPNIVTMVRWLCYEFSNFIN